MTVVECTDPAHKLHHVFIGGRRDGEVVHHTFSNTRPESMGTMLVDGQRSWYVRDDEDSTTDVLVYRCIGVGREDPRR